MEWWQITERQRMVAPAGLCNTGHHSGGLSNTGYHCATSANAEKNGRIFLLEHVNPEYVTACVSRHSQEHQPGDDRLAAAHLVSVGHACLTGTGARAGLGSGVPGNAGPRREALVVGMTSNSLPTASATVTQRRRGGMHDHQPASITLDEGGRQGRKARCA
jgi:hypothetical protein